MAVEEGLGGGDVPSLEVLQQTIVVPLLAWFHQTGRDLPWRKTYNPYHVWISEIMLQQTQMERGVGYFQRWVARFPSVRAVAEADEQEILKYWEGLGYYARARNLQKAAKKMVAEHGGEVPRELASLRELPGVGPYTAAAIASVAGQVDVAVVDANVCRVFARIFDLDQPVNKTAVRRRIETLAESMLPKGRARHYNQALMDLGGLVCRPRNPDCGNCPVGAACLSLKRGTVAARPVLPEKKKARQIKRVTALIEHQGQIFIQQRGTDDLWPGLWELPTADCERDELAVTTLKEAVYAQTGLQIEVGRELTTVRHQYTTNKIVLTCYWCTLVGRQTDLRLSGPIACQWLFREELHRYGFPSGHRKIIQLLKKGTDLFS